MTSVMTNVTAAASNGAKTNPDSGLGRCLRLSALQCERGDRVLFTALDLVVSEGQGLQLHGANGSGKTSLLRIVAGLSQQYQGEVTWCGMDIQTNPFPLQQDLLYLSHTPGVNRRLSAFENLRWWAGIHAAHADTALIKQALERVGLGVFLNTMAANLSAGQQRRIALARLFLSRHCLWVLDEPFTAIDAAGVEALEAQIAAHIRAQGMVIITTHQTMQLSVFEHFYLHDMRVDLGLNES